MGWILRPGGRPTYVSDAPQPPAKAPLGHETLAARARATVEAEGAPAWPEGLVEAVALALWNDDRRACDFSPLTALYQRDEGEEIPYLRNATAALDAVRAWEGRE